MVGVHVLVGITAAAAVGCGGGLPLLYPARTLATGVVRATGGTSGNFVVGGLANDLQTAELQSSRNGAAPGSAGAADLVADVTRELASFPLVTAS